MSVPQSASADAFHAFEHAGWQGASRYYDDAFGSLTRQAIDPPLDAAQLRENHGTVEIPMPAVLAAALKP